MITIPLDMDDITYAQRLSWVRSKWKHKDWQTYFKKGVSNNKKDPAHAERLGVLGELAVQKWLGDVIQIDENAYDKGDKGIDTVLPGGKILDIKTHLQPAYWAIEKKGIYGPFYIGATDMFGELKPMKADLYLFATVNRVWQDDHELDVDFALRLCRMDKYQTEKFDGFPEETMDLQNVVMQEEPKMFHGVDYHRCVTKMEMRIWGYITRQVVLANREERLAPILKPRNKNDQSKNYYIREEEFKSPERFAKNIRKLLAHV